MSHKKKTDFLKLFNGSAFAMTAALLVYLLKNDRFCSIVPVVIVGAVAALLTEMLILFVLRGSSLVKRTVKIFLLTVVNISVFFSVIAYSFPPSIILQPHSDSEAYCVLKNNISTEEIIFEGEQGKISGWFYNAAGEDAPVVLYFYGNFETASSRLLQLSTDYSSSAFYGCNFAIFDYPSYGNSEGKCTDESILSFALDVYDYLSLRSRKIIVMGYSVGTGPACYLAGKRDISALILYAPYANSVDLYNNIIDIFHGPLEYLVTFDINSAEYAKSVQSPVLILASDKDELIPFESSLRLSGEFGSSCSFVKVMGITHNQFLSDSVVKSETGKFIKEVTQ